MERKQYIPESTDILPLAEEYAESLRVRHFAESTIYGTLRTLRIFADYLGEDQSIHSVTETKLLEYLRTLENYKKKDGNPLTKGTIALILGEIRGFFNYLSKKHLILINPTRLLPEIRVSRLPRGSLTEKEAELIFSTVDLETPLGLRDRAILEILYATGLRRREVLNLTINDVQLDSLTVFVRQGKGRKDRVVPLGERAALWVRRYLSEARPKILCWKTYKNKETEVLFLGKGGRLSSNLSKIIRDYKIKAGIEKPGSCHIFRHTAGTLMLEGGADIRYVQELLGHSSLETTKQYTHITITKLRETFNRTHPSVFAELEDVIDKKSVSPKQLIRTSRRPKSEACFIPKRNQEWPLTNLADLIQDEFSLFVIGKAEETKKEYERSLREFAAFCAKEMIEEISDVTFSVIEKYQRHLSELKTKNGNPLSIITQIGKLSAVRSSFQFFLRRGKVLFDPTEAMVLPRSGLHLPTDILSLSDIEKILSLPDVSRPYGLRDRAILEILFATAMRRSELCSLALVDLDLEKNTVFVKEGKYAKDRVIPAGKRAMDWTLRYIDEVRPRLIMSARDMDHPYVFVADHGERIGEDTISRSCKRYLKKAGINKKGSSHLFRHTAATMMLENGADIRSLQEYLGHSDLSTTQIYTRVSVKKLQEVHAASHPGEKHFRERKERLEKEKLLGELQNQVSLLAEEKPENKLENREASR